MKKIASLLIALALVLSCTAAMAELTFTTGGTSGTYYAYGSVLAQYIQNNSDVAVTAIAGNGSAANIDLLDIGDAQLGFGRTTWPPTPTTASASSSTRATPSIPSPPCARCTPRPCSW